MMLRSFIAIEIPPSIQNTIVESISDLKGCLARSAVRWVNPCNIHLTLKFLGDVSHATLSKLAETLREEFAGHEKFTFQIGGIGAFPSARRARVIWAGIQNQPALDALWHDLEAALLGQGFANDEQKFSPHLTIGRVAREATISDLQHIRNFIEGGKPVMSASVHVETISIYKSDLQAGGPVYARLYSLPLKSSEPILK